MADLRRLLAQRTALYEQAERVVDTRRSRRALGAGGGQAMREAEGSKGPARGARGGSARSG